MHLKAMGIRFAAMGAMAGMMLSASRSWSLELPAEAVSKLVAEEFSVREKAQQDLLAWAREHREPAMDELLRQSRKAAEPEVRQRCLAVLRNLVMDDYLKSRDGYLGINMQDEIANVPGDDKPRAAIRVVQVVADSAAQQGGLQANDLIVSLNGQLWYETPASQLFTTKIRALGPGAEVSLKLMRNGIVKETKVKLGRRPAVADNPMLMMGQNAEAIEQNAKDEYFRQWMDQRKLRK